MGRRRWPLVCMPVAGARRGAMETRDSFDMGSGSAGAVPARAGGLSLRASRRSRVGLRFRGIAEYPLSTYRFCKGDIVRVHIVQSLIAIGLAAQLCLAAPPVIGTIIANG